MSTHLLFLNSVPCRTHHFLLTRFAAVVICCTQYMFPGGISCHTVFLFKMSFRFATFFFLSLLFYLVFGRRGEKIENLTSAILLLELEPSTESNLVILIVLESYTYFASVQIYLIKLCIIKRFLNLQLHLIYKGLYFDLYKLNS